MSYSAVANDKAFFSVGDDLHKVWLSSEGDVGEMRVPMRKLFRMQYESCNGQCYADDDVLQVRALGLDVQGAAVFLNRLLAMHGPSCGNPHLAFRLDVDDEHNMFVASMQRYGALDMYMDKTALGAMDKLIEGALKYYATDEYKALVTERPGAGHGVCHHGEEKKLLEFAIKFSDLSDTDKAELSKYAEQALFS